MRVWDISPDKLCRFHLLGEHTEIHALWSILINNKKGFAKHPETLRWKGKLNALYNRHEKIVNEMEKRKYNHKSPLNKTKAIGEEFQNEFVNTVDEQIQILKRNRCKCKI
ncbi:MAG: hypothetical protein JSW62_03775 [Thermoplasmatales archaeon]|nr:MAG: hypothetical protein JSW62_03775 [Thermoplasmatales archaeon]